MLYFPPDKRIEKDIGKDKNSTESPAQRVSVEQVLLHYSPCGTSGFRLLFR